MGTTKFIEHIFFVSVKETIKLILSSIVPMVHYIILVTWIKSSMLIDLFSYDKILFSNV